MASVARWARVAIVARSVPTIEGVYVILVNILVIRLFYVFDYKRMLSVRLVNVCGTTLPS